MSDHSDLHDAFAEYERRADAVGAARAGGARPGRTSRTPLLLVAASVALVLAVAGVVVWLAADNGSPGHTGAPVGGPPSSRVSATATPRTSAPVSGTTTPSAGTSVLPIVSTPSRTATPTPARTEPTGRPSAPVTTAVPTDTAPSGGADVPANARQMTRALRRVLGDTATVQVDQHYGNYLLGVLTVASTGARGGFDIQAVAGQPGDRATCEDLGKHSHCTKRRTARGGSLALERETYSSGSDQLYFANYVFPGGATYAMHLSNLTDPKGSGPRLGVMPPLTPQQVAGIVRSARWPQS